MKVLFALVTTLALSTSSAYPSFKLSCDKGNTAAACLNRKVTLEAHMAGFDKSPASEVMQHPQMLTPFDKDLEQSYTQISQNLGQVVVLSKAISCPKVLLKGSLSQISLNCQGGQKGKCSYRNYVIRVDSFSCQK